MIRHAEFKRIAKQHRKEAARSDMAGLSCADCDAIVDYAEQLAIKARRTMQFLGRMATVDKADDTTLHDMRDWLIKFRDELKKAIG